MRNKCTSSTFPKSGCKNWSISAVSADKYYHFTGGYSWLLETLISNIWLLINSSIHLQNICLELPMYKTLPGSENFRGETETRYPLSKEFKCVKGMASNMDYRLEFRKIILCPSLFNCKFTFIKSDSPTEISYILI